MEHREPSKVDSGAKPARAAVYKAPRCLFTFYFEQLYCPIGITPTGESGCLPRGKLAVTASRYATYGGACWVFWCFHNPPNSDMDYGIFNVCTDFNACACTRGCTDTVRESALEVDCGRKIPCRTRESTLPQRCAGPTFYQLSYIPTCTHH